MLKAIRLVPLSLANGDGAPRLNVLDRLSADLARALSVSCHVETAAVLVDDTHDEMRNQAWSTAILARLAARPVKSGVIHLGVTALDLYVPVLTFVFGEAQISGSCAVVSTRRLDNAYYGLPANEAALATRLFKEALHEIGHTQGLRHCTDWRCSMSSAHSVERVDLRQAAFCATCARVF